MDSTRKMARIAGFLYLMIVLSGVFSIMYVPAKLMVKGNASATVNNILSHLFLYRTNILISLVSSVVFLFLALALYLLFKEVDRHLSSLMVILVIVQTPFAFVDVLIQIATLEFARGAEFLSVFNVAQREALAMVCLHINSLSMTAADLFWGLWLFPLGLLVIRSGFMPKFLGIWLIINGFAYISLCVTGFLTPHYLGVVNNITLPLLLGEVAFTLWLLVMGAKTPKTA